jgi:DNA polymerase III subunit alpha
MPEPTIPVCEPWGNIEQLKYEKDVVGFYISGHPLDTYKLEMDNFCIHQISDMKKIEEFKNKDLVFGGVVTGVHNGITKTGNPWGKIIIEDYNESSEIAFFGEDYVKFKQYMVNGLFLFIRGKVSERFRGSGNFEFKVSTIQLLSELRDKLARSITIQVPLRSLNDEFINVVNNIITENSKVESRQCVLRFKIIDSEENITVELPSKRIKVSPNNEFLGMLKEKQLDFKLN